jgi:hypothetical protein
VRGCAWPSPAGDTIKLSPRARGTALDSGAIPSIPFHLIEPFLNEAMIFTDNELAVAPRIVATQEGRVLLSRGDTAYVRGELGSNTSFRIFREPKPLKDPTTGRAARLGSRLCRRHRDRPSGETRTGATASRRSSRPLSPVTSIRRSERRRPAGAGAGARVHQLRSACARLARSPGRSSRCMATRSRPARTRSSR